MSKRCFDLICATVGLVLLAPLFGIIALLVRLTGRPTFYKQERVGQWRHKFQILKFRTMSTRGPTVAVTAAGDPRVTKIGRWLRRWKLDELPQLVNVICGEMSIVGPRPEVAKFVAFYTPEQEIVLSVRPGITDLATVLFRNEELLLGQQLDPEAYYIHYCLPIKLALSAEYIRRRSLMFDIRIIIVSLLVIVIPRLCSASLLGVAAPTMPPLQPSL